jgi:cytoskeleton protein RodZ
MKAMAGTSSAVTPGKTGGAIATTGTKGAGGVSVSSLPPLASTAAPPARGTVGADNLAAKAVQAPAPAAGQVLGAKAARVLLHVRGLTRVLVEGADGTVYINRILHPGDTYRVPDMMGLSLTTPDGGAVGLELDGHDLGVAGHSGEMTEALPLDPQALVDRSGSRNPG